MHFSLTPCWHPSQWGKFDFLYLIYGRKKLHPFCSCTSKYKKVDTTQRIEVKGCFNRNFVIPRSLPGSHKFQGVEKKKFLSSLVLSFGCLSTVTTKIVTDNRGVPLINFLTPFFYLPICFGENIIFFIVVKTT